MTTARELPAHTGVGFECIIGHQLHERNTGWISGEAYCLDCVALAHQAADLVTGRLVLTLLNLAPMPSRAEVYAS